jgi:hypothetical protein
MKPVLHSSTNTAGIADIQVVRPDTAGAAFCIVIPPISRAGKSGCFPQRKYAQSRR